MKRYFVLMTGLFAAVSAYGENLADVDELLCSVSKVVLCTEVGECFDIEPWEADVPQFVVVDTRKKMISTTQASARPRSTPIRTYVREEGLIFLQGIEAGRAFSFVIDEATGLVTVAVSRDGISVSVFGACTDADVKPAS